MKLGILAAIAAAAFASAAFGQTIAVPPKRLGNNTEGMTLVQGGRWDGRLVAIDGYDVIGIHVRGRSPSHGARDSEKLFDVKGLGFAPRGIAWVPPLRKFVFSSPHQADVASFFTANEDGTGLAALPLQHLEGDSDFIYIEGITWLPHDAPAFANHLAFVLITGNGIHVRFAKLDGQVVGGFDVPHPLSDFIGAITYRASTARLATAHGADVWECDFTGACAGPKATVPQVSSIESVVALPDGRLACADYGTGVVQFVDRGDQVQDGLLRDFRIGLAISRPLAQAWDSQRNEILLYASQGTYEAKVLAIASAAGPIHERIDLRASGLDSIRGLTHVASTDTIAASLFHTIYSFSPAGELLSEAATAFININGIGDIAAEDVYVIKQGGVAARRIRFLSRTGEEVAASLLLSAPPNGQRIAAFGPPGGVKFAAGNRIYARNGALLQTIDAAAIGLSSLFSVVPITSGPLAGKFLGFDAADTSEVVVFSLD